MPLWGKLAIAGFLVLAFLYVIGVIDDRQERRSNRAIRDD